MPTSRIPRIDLRRWWHEPPAVATTYIIRFSTGGFYICGAALGFLAALLTPLLSRAPVAAVAVTGSVVVIGCFFILRGDRLPRWAYDVNVAVALGGCVIFLLLGRAAYDVVPAAFGVPLLFAMVNVAFTFSLRWSLVYLVIISAVGMTTMLSVGSPLSDVVLIQGAGLSIAAMIAWVARMADIAEEDALTRLYNRRGFDRQLEEAAARASAGGGLLSLALFDLDRFKEINDSQGHEAGDRLLAECARAWSQAIPASASLSRYGGDEFALLMPGMLGGQAADLVDVLRGLAPAGITVSAGVSGWQPGDAASDLFRNADIALYDAKIAGRDQTSVYGDPDRAAAQLERALECDELYLEYQPVCVLREGRPEVAGYEALVRWQHPEQGLILPDDFVPAAERTGAIRFLGWWILREVVGLIASQERSLRSWWVKVSPAQLRSPTFAGTLAWLAHEHDVDLSRLVIEVTESAFESGTQVEATIQELRALGVQIAMDDFGSGHSSLPRLATLPLDIIKLDGALVQGVDRTSYDAPILEAVAVMARSLGLQVAAEHVESAHQLEVLQRLGFDCVQGPVLAEPQRWSAGLADLTIGAGGAGHRRSAFSARLTTRAPLRRPSELSPDLG